MHDTTSDDLQHQPYVPCKSQVLTMIVLPEHALQSGGPSWEVEVGRKDSRTASLLGANNNLPAPTSGVATLVQKFRNVGLSAKDMVALSGMRTYVLTYGYPIR
jgi:peroxidase